MNAEAAAKQQGTRSMIKRFREGIVLSDKSDKTITVQVTRIVKHSKYEKVVRNRIKYTVHDENNAAKEGDKVRIRQTRPLSKTKRWTLVEVLKK